MSFVTLFPVRRDVIELFEVCGVLDFWFCVENIVVNGFYFFDEWKFRYEIMMKRNLVYWVYDVFRIYWIVWMEIF